MTSVEAIAAGNNPNLIFKAQGGAIFSAPLTATMPTAFTATASATLVELDPDDWTNLGLVDKGAGITFPRETGSEDTESWGYNEPTRTDITSDITSATFTLQETSRAVLEMYDFVDLSTVTADATTGEIAYNKPLASAPQFRRLIFFAYDGVGTDRRYRYLIMPRAQVTAVEDESWAQATATAYPVTVRATVDTVLGYAVRRVLAGPGQKSRNVAAGFTPAV